MMCRYFVTLCFVCRQSQLGLLHSSPHPLRIPHSTRCQQSDGDGHSFVIGLGLTVQKEICTSAAFVVACILVAEASCTSPSVSLCVERFCARSILHVPSCSDAVSLVDVPIWPSSLYRLMYRQTRSVQNYRVIILSSLDRCNEVFTPIAVLLLSVP